MEEFPTDKPAADWAPHDLLFLFLGLNDKFRMPPHAWEYLSIRDLVHVTLLSRSIRTKLRRVEYTRCRDGRDYLVPFPGFPGLLSTPIDLKIGAGLFQHQLASLEAMFRAENPGVLSANSGPIAFDSLRGGILGDAPGLGKTITMLALIASTAGVRPINPPEFWDEEGIRNGWTLLRSNEASRESLLFALRPIRLWVNKALHKKDPLIEVYKSLERFFSPPYSDDRLQTIREFEIHVKRTLHSFVPQSMLELFRQNLLDLKAGLDKRNRSLLSSSTKGQRFTWERNLIPSNATLIVVPDALMEHWFQQIEKHLNLVQFADENENHDTTRTTDSSEKGNTTTVRGVVYLDGIGDLADARVPLGKVYLGAPVPPAEELNKYLMVVTTFSRCQGQFKKEVTAGRMQQDTSNARTITRRGRSSGRRQNNILQGDSTCETGTPSPLLQLRWLRLVVDEGHELGTHEAGNSVTCFINKVAAERRWVLSGTPTTGNEDDKQFAATALDQLQRLLFFLRHPTYGNIPISRTRSTYTSKLPYASSGNTTAKNKNRECQKAKEKWLTAVKDPFLNKKREGRQELLRVLREVMVMHRKEDINLPKPCFKQVEIDVPIPDIVQQHFRLNRLLNSQLLNEYLHSEDYQSLVDQSQGRYIIRAIRGAQRELRERGGRLGIDQELHAPVAEYDETKPTIDRRPIKAVVYSSEKNILLSVAEHLYRELSIDNIAEMYGDIGDLSSELSRFRNGCKKSRQCPVCSRWNDLSGDQRRDNWCQHVLLEVVMHDAPHTRFLIEPERIMRALSPGDPGGNVSPDRLGGELLSSYSSHRKLWQVGDTLEVTIHDRHPLMPTRESEETWSDWGSHLCKRLAESTDHQGSDWFFGQLPWAGSQDRVVVNLAKWQACGKFHNHRRWYKGPQLSDVPIETIKEDVFVLCLDAEFAHGLDLSFATHIFLLEPIDDAALLEQVTSRAHRLGATGPVVVETVNPLYKLSPDTQLAIESTQLITENNLTKKIVCYHCYRQFDSMVDAEEHERMNCPRNPENINLVDPFHLSSVYREIRPPPPLKAETGEQ